MSTVHSELWSIFDARRVKAPELKGVDAAMNALAGHLKNRRSILPRLQQQAARIELLEPKVANLGSTQFRETVQEHRDLARVNKLTGEHLDMGMAIIREGAKRAIGLRPFPVQIIGALAMCEGYISEMATGEGKTLTASLAASLWGWMGRPVHIITVNDYLVARDAEEMGPVYQMLGMKVGFVVHESTPSERGDHYRRNVVYITSKELVADFLRDQILLGNLRSSTQTSVGRLLMGDHSRRQQLQVPGLFRVLVDEADSLLVDEAVTPLIISNSPDTAEVGNTELFKQADDLAVQLVEHRDFTVDREVRNVDLTVRGQDRLAELPNPGGFWKGERRREELVTQALTARFCFIRDEQYLIDEEGKIQIIDEFTGRVMKDRSWRHGLHQAIEIKEESSGAKKTADKENLARLSFQRFFRQYPIMGGMTGTAWEAGGELWQIYQRPIVRIPTNRPCIRVHLPTLMFETSTEKYDAAVKRVCELNDKGVPVLVGTRSVLSSEEVSRRLQALNRPHRVLNASQTANEANIVAEAGQRGKITVATNMAGRGTDIKLSKGIADLGGLHVVATEPATSYRVDRQLFGRAARQGDPGCAQMFVSADDDLFMRHAPMMRKMWRNVGPDRLIRMAQNRAERLARFNRKQVLRSDDWMDQSLPF
jgi:preprotein translocase subunit SecA